MKTIDLQVEGMSCGSCVKHVTQALQPLPGVSGVEVDLQSGHVRLSGELAQGSAPLLMALTVCGLPAKLATDAPIPAATSQLKASGCHSGGAGCGCRRRPRYLGLLQKTEIKHARPSGLTGDSA